MNRTPRSAARRKGMAVIITALMLGFVIPIVGLAIDAGVLYSIKAKLQSSVDAASMAAARSLSNGLTIAEQETSASNRAQAFFHANFPNNLLATGAKTISVAVAETAFRTRTVTVTADVAAPVYFMRVMGFGSTTVAAIGKASRRDVNVIIVLDRSGSLDTAGACDDVENASLGFVNLFANQRDRLGLITYGGSYRVDFAPNLVFKTGAGNLVSKLGGIYPNGCNGWTGSAQGLWKGYEEIVTINEPGALNVILFFTDGIPNAITADWRIKKLTTSTSPTAPTRCYDWTNGEYRFVSGGSGAVNPDWNPPATQAYRGFISGQDGVGRSGVRGHTAGTIPVSDDPGAVSIPVGFSGASKTTSRDCYFRTTTSNVPQDIAYYPDADIYGNSVFGWKSINTYPGGHAYAGKVRIDDEENQQNAAINAVDNAAQRIRNHALNPNINVMIYAIGLGGAGAAEHALLERVANDPNSSSYDSSALEGMYVYAPTAADLNMAFVKIASEILRIAQ